GGDRARLDPQGARVHALEQAGRGRAPGLAPSHALFEDAQAQHPAAPPVAFRAVPSPEGWAGARSLPEIWAAGGPAGFAQSSEIARLRPYRRGTSVAVTSAIGRIVMKKIEAIIKPFK